MGYRLTFYDCPNEVVDKYKDITSEDGDNDDFQFPDQCTSVHEMWYDVTMWLYWDEFSELCKENKEELLWSRLFNNKMNFECDMSFNTMNKEQCLFFINMVRKHIYSDMKAKFLAYDGIDELAELEKHIENHEDVSTFIERKYKGNRKNVSVIEKARLNCIDNQYYLSMFSIYHKDDEIFCEMLDKPYVVDEGMGWFSVLANLIYVYKTFDWKNHCILVCGG